MEELQEPGYKKDRICHICGEHFIFEWDWPLWTLADAFRRNPNLQIVCSSCGERIMNGNLPESEG